MKQAITLRDMNVAPAAQTALSVVAVAGALFLGACIRVPLPFSPVPVTLQTFVVLVAACTLGPWRASAGALLFTGLGLAGAPLFAVTSLATFGYLIGFAAAPHLIARFRRPAAGILAGTLLIYATGVAWLCLWSGLGVWHGLTLGLLPFLPGDMLKAVAAHRVVLLARPETE